MARGPTTKASRTQARKAAPKRPRKKPVARKPRAPVAHPPTPAIRSEDALDAGIAALLGLDAAVVGHMLETGGRPPLRAREPGFAGLTWIVVSQQVSVASANAIHARVAEKFQPLDAAGIRAAAEPDLQACGLSRPKIRTLKAIAEAVHEGALDFAALDAMEVEAARAQLMAIKGIGPWTADIFLLFCLGHADAWPAGDLALQEAARIALKLRARPDAARLETIGERWRPWRGVAARLLWAYYRVQKQGRSGMALAT